MEENNEQCRHITYGIPSYMIQDKISVSCSLKCILSQNDLKLLLIWFVLSFVLQHIIPQPERNFKILRDCFNSNHSNYNMYSLHKYTTTKGIFSTKSYL